MQRRPLKGRLKAAGRLSKEFHGGSCLTLPAGGQKLKGCISLQEHICSLPPIFRRQLHDLRESMISPGATIFPNMNDVLQEQLGLRRAPGDSSRTAAKSGLSCLGTTPAIKDSVHLHLCSLQDMNSMVLFASGRSAVNSLTFAHSRRATASSLSHNMRKWRPSSSVPPHKIQGSARITVRVIFCGHRRMTCMVGRRPSLAHSKTSFVGC